MTMRDLACALGLPLLVVARNALGTINHTALTVQAARQASLEVLGIVLNDVGEPDESSASNATALARWGGTRVLGTMPHLPDLEQTTLASAGHTVSEALGLVAQRTLTH